MMKKHFKKLVSLVLSLIMVVGMSVTTFAAEVQPAATTVGTLTIFSSNDGGSSSWDTSGHAFIAFKNSSSSSIRVGGLNVGAGHEITFGTWGNKSQHTGIWYNLESYFANNASAYGNRVSLSMSVTQSNIDTINDIISKNDKWSLTNVGLMFIFALISEIPFDIGFFSQYSQMEGTFPFYLKYQNVFFTLFLGLLTLVCLERLSCKSEVRTDKIKSAILQVICVATLALVAELIRCDYGMQGILFIVAFYICRNHRIYQVLLFLLAYMGATGNQPPLFTILACLLILLYNGKRGKLKLKYFFYVFYPAHIFILYLIQIWIGKNLL